MTTVAPPHQPGFADRELSKSALWGLILGISSLFFWLLTGIPAMVLSIIGLVKTSKPELNLSGKGLAIGGLITSLLGILIIGPIIAFAFLAALSMPAYQGIRDKGIQVKHMSNVKQIVLSCRTFASDNDGLYPEKLSDLTPDYLPEDVADDLLAYQPNFSEPPQDYLYFSGFNDSSPATKILIASPAPHRGKRIVGYVGGAVAIIPEEEFQSAIAQQKKASSH